MADKYVKLDDVLEIVRIVMTDKRITHKHRALNRNLKQLPFYNVFDPVNPPVIETVSALDAFNVPACCQNCPNHPSNGGSGICNCVLPYMTTTTVSISTNNYNPKVVY